MKLIEVLSCVPNDVKFSITDEQLANVDNDFDVALEAKGDRWFILKGKNKDVFATQVK